MARLLDYLDQLDRWSRFVMSICVDGTIGPTVKMDPPPRFDQGTDCAEDADTDCGYDDWTANSWDVSP